MEKWDFSEIIKSSGLKNTKHRISILEALERSDRPVSADQLYTELRLRKMSANLSTVYRTLETLCEKNLVSKVNIPEGDRTFFEFNRMVHKHYLVCLSCKKFLAIEHCPLRNYEKTLEEKTDFTITGHRLNVFGYCPECRQKEDPVNAL
ncbi:MAG: transcriptional repressor [Clostridiales bacterium]|jgi:Fur family ferric uptake transcriptional regulator|nr:transcriptional repressor [Clostridiales bacterium]